MRGYEHWVQQRGKRLGSGCFGAVYSLTSTDTMVLKVSTDDGTRDYIEFCYKLTKMGLMDAPACKAMPRVYDFGVGGERDWWCVMERCDETFTSLRMDSERREALGVSLVPEMNSWCGAEDLVASTVSLLNSVFYSWFCSDVHGSNVMWSSLRKCWVLTDPSSGNFSGTSNRALMQATGMIRSTLPAEHPRKVRKTAAWMIPQLQQQFHMRQ